MNHINVRLSGTCWDPGSAQQGESVAARPGHAGVA